MNGTVARTFDEERYLAETGYIFVYTAENRTAGINARS